MPTIITRLYESEAAAEEVCAAMRDAGIGADAITMVTSETAGGDVEGAVAAAGVPSDDVASVAMGIGAGGTLVLAYAGFGNGMALKKAAGSAPATRVFDRYSSDLQGRAGLSVIKGKTYYLSDPKRPPLSDRRHALSSRMGWKMLSDRRKGREVLTENDRKIMPFKPLTGWKLGTRLSNKATPFSDAMGWKTLKDPKPAEDLLSRDPTPFSTWLGWKTLTPY
ncbi:MAG: hypothetical protein AAF577_16085 [Pseudomonadota bacterium]